MIILGIDPGFARLGYGLIKKNGSRLEVISYGVLETPANSQRMEERMNWLCQEIKKITNLHQPDSVALEKVFFFKNQKTAIKIGQIQGALMTTLLQSGYQSHFYTPLQVKQALTSYGRASKKQIQLMVQRLLNLPSLPKPDDAADGLAIAICHANSLVNKF